MKITRKSGVYIEVFLRMKLHKIKCLIPIRGVIKSNYKAKD